MMVTVMVVVGCWWWWLWWWWWWEGKEVGKNKDLGIKMADHILAFIDIIKAYFACHFGTSTLHFTLTIFLNKITYWIQKRNPIFDLFRSSNCVLTKMRLFTLCVNFNLQWWLFSITWKSRLDIKKWLTT